MQNEARQNNYQKYFILFYSSTVVVYLRNKAPIRDSQQQMMLPDSISPVEDIQGQLLLWS